MFTVTISFKIEDIDSYYVCKHTYEIFKEKKNCSHNLMIWKNRAENEMIIIVKTVVIFFNEYFILANVTISTK